MDKQEKILYDYVQGEEKKGYTPGRKADQDKIPMELLPTPALEEIARVLAFGAQKYDRWNWRGGIAYSRVIGAALRHIFSWLNGEDKDPETGLSHLAHAGCCILFLLTYEKERPEWDDRYKTEKRYETLEKNIYASKTRAVY